MELLKSVTVHCPYCGEPQDVDVDCSVDTQSYIDDCQVCCQPITVSVAVDEHHEPTVNVRSENE